jgi:hypothetical protein
MVGVLKELQSLRQSRDSAKFAQKGYMIGDERRLLHGSTL